MSSGFKYNIKDNATIEELCDVKTLQKKRGSYRLDKTGLNIGTTLPRFTPVCADTKTHTCVVVRNVKVAEDATADATSIKVAKHSLAYAGMLLGTGSKGAKITAIDTSDPTVDVLTLEAAFGAKLSAGDVLFEASAAGGTTPKNTANFVVYETTKIDEGIVLVALTMQAYEIQEDKLVLPISKKDKEGLTARFQFD